MSIMSSSSNRQKPAMAQHARAAGPGKRKRSLGVTLIEAIAAIGVMSAATVGLVALVDDAMDNTRAHATAQHMSAIGQSASIYVRDNFASIAAIATPTHAALVRVSDMVTTGHLSVNFSPINPRGQSVCIAVLEPEPNRLLGLVVAQGGETIDDVTLGHIAATIGGSGGAVYAATPSEIRGAMGGWSLPLSTFSVTNHLSQACNGAAGTAVPQVGRPVKALWFVDGAANAALMRDAIPGNPAMNTMNTPILMGAGAVVTTGASCTTPGAVARSAEGASLSCAGGVWQSSDTCRHIAEGTNLNDVTIPAGTQSCVNGANLLNAPTADWFFVEIIRHVNTLNHYATQRATGMTGAASGRVWTRSQHGGAWTAWRAVGVDHLGNMAIPGTATINRLGGALELTTVVTPGTTCETNGQIARSADGLLLSCQDRNWLTPVRMPRIHRFLFTSSTAWRVPEGVLSAFVTMSGGGGSGAGWRISNALITGHSGGFVFSHPINLVPGETLQIVVGYGGWGAQPVHIPGAPHPWGYFVPNPHDDGLGGHPGGRSAIISPSGGILLECAGGSGASFGRVNALSGGVWIPGPQTGAITWGDGMGTIVPSRLASGAFASHNSPGACGPNNYGLGVRGTTTWQMDAGDRPGGMTPFGYGSGGAVGTWGCHLDPSGSFMGLCVSPGSGRAGVVMLDVLY